MLGKKAEEQKKKIRKKGPKAQIRVKTDNVETESPIRKVTDLGRGGGGRHPGSRAPEEAGRELHGPAVAHLRPQVSQVALQAGVQSQEERRGRCRAPRGVGQVNLGRHFGQVCPEVHGPLYVFVDQLGSCQGPAQAEKEQEVDEVDPHGRPR